MTQTDRAQTLTGYYPSAWPVECGGNRRQKAAAGGLFAGDGEASITTVKNGRWNVMMIRRGDGELYMGGTMAAFTGPPPHGWLQRLDPQTLDVQAESPALPCGEHVWCGAIAAHANGDIYSVNGNYLHRLNAGCEVVVEKRLPVDQAHNGLLILSDGTIVTKDLRLAGQGGSTITRLDPNSLEVIDQPLVLPEGSMGRIASDSTAQTDHIYVPGIEHVWRINVADNVMVLDADWQPKYRDQPSEQGLAWDGCISANCLWMMDNGDIDPIRAIYGQHPNGRFAQASDKLSWRRPAPWTGGQRLLRIDLTSQEVVGIAPFHKSGNTPGGGIIAPPVNVPEHNLCIAWDSLNGKIAGIDTSGDQLTSAWQLDARPTMQPVVFPETGELVINDFRDAGDFLIVVDIPSGKIIDEVNTGSSIANGMFLTPGWNRDVYYCSTLSCARAAWG